MMYKKRSVCIVVIMVTAITTLVAMTFPSREMAVFADDSMSITVEYNGVEKKTFTETDLRPLMEGRTYNYSTYNSFSSFKYFTDVEGVTVENLVAASGIPLSSIDDQHIIKVISGGDQLAVEFTAEQLFDEERYCYPNGNIDTQNGKKGSIASKSGNVVAVPTIISLNTVANDKESKGRLMIGQKEPNEQTNAAWNKFITRGGKIDVTTDYATSIAEATISPASDTLTWGSLIKINHKQIKDVKIYYTTDSLTEPAMNSDLYNYYTYGGVDQSIKTAEIRASAARSTFTVKAITTKFGYLDSAVTTKTYNVVSPTITGVKAALAGYSALKITWNQVAGADGYKIRWSTSKNGPYNNVITVKGATNNYTHKTLKTGKTYYYKISAYQGSTESKSSVVVSAKPVLNKATGVKAKAKGKKKIRITAKKVSGANGYYIYRSTKKNKGFKKIKTVKKTTLKYDDKKVKKGKKYYYKIKAYRTVDKKKVLCPTFSKTVSAKAK